MIITVKDYKKICEYWLNGMSQRTIARLLGIVQNTVKKYYEGGWFHGKEKTTTVPTGR